MSPERQAPPCARPPAEAADPVVADGLRAHGDRGRSRARDDPRQRLVPPAVPRGGGRDRRRRRGDDPGGRAKRYRHHWRDRGVRHLRPGTGVHDPARLPPTRRLFVRAATDELHRRYPDRRRDVPGHRHRRRAVGRPRDLVPGPGPPRRGLGARPRRGPAPAHRRHRAREPLGLRLRHGDGREPGGVPRAAAAPRLRLVPRLAHRQPRRVDAASVALAFAVLDLGGSTTAARPGPRGPDHADGRAPPLRWRARRPPPPRPRPPGVQPLQRGAARPRPPSSSSPVTPRCGRSLGLQALHGMASGVGLPAMAGMVPTLVPPRRPAARQRAREHVARALRPSPARPWARSSSSPSGPAGRSSRRGAPGSAPRPCCCRSAARGCRTGLRAPPQGSTGPSTVASCATGGALFRATTWLWLVVARLRGAQRYRRRGAGSPSARRWPRTPSGGRRGAGCCRPSRSAPRRDGRPAPRAPPPAPVRRHARRRAARRPDRPCSGSTRTCGRSSPPPSSPASASRCSAWAGTSRCRRTSPTPSCPGPTPTTPSARWRRCPSDSSSTDRWATGSASPRSSCGAGSPTSSSPSRAGLPVGPHPPPGRRRRGPRPLLTVRPAPTGRARRAPTPPGPPRAPAGRAGRCRRGCARAPGPGPPAPPDGRPPTARRGRG